MTPKEKAQELVDKFQVWHLNDFDDKYLNIDETKKLAICCVEEIVKEIDIIMFPNPFKQYWNKVKQEIEKI
jgi:hypothetical protein